MIKNFLSLTVILFFMSSSVIKGESIVLDLDDIYTKTKCFNDLLDTTDFEVSNITLKQKTGTIKVKYGDESVQTKSGVLTIYSDAEKGQRIAQESDGFYEIKLNTLNNDNFLLFEYNPLKNETPVVCFDFYYTNKGKEITFVTKDTLTQNAYILFREEEMKFFINTAGNETDQVCESLVPKLVGSENITYTVNIELRDETDKAVRVGNLTLGSSLDLINIYDNTPKAYIYIEIKLIDKKIFSSADEYTLLRPKTNEILEQETFKLEIDQAKATEVKEVPLVYYYLVNSIVSESQLVYRTDINDFNTLKAYLWEQGYTFNKEINTFKQTLVDVDRTLIKDRNINNPIFTFVIYGDLSANKFIIEDIISYENLEYFTYYPKSLYFYPNEVLYRTNNRIHEDFEKESIYKLTNILGNTKLTNNEGTFTGEKCLYDEFKETSNNYYYNSEKDRVYFKPIESNDEFISYSMAKYKKVQGNIRIKEATVNESYDNNYYYFYKEDKDEAIISFNPILINNLLIKLPNDLKDNFGKEFSLVYNSTETNETITISINEANPLYIIENIKKEINLQFSTTNKNIIFEIVTVPKTLKDISIFITEEINEVSNDTGFDSITPIIFTLNSSNNADKYVVAEIDDQTITSSAWKYYGDCNFPSINLDQAVKITTGEGSPVRFTFLNDYYKNNQINKYSSENVCLILFLQQTEGKKSIPVKIQYQEEQTLNVEDIYTSTKCLKSEGLKSQYFKIENIQDKHKTGLVRVKYGKMDDLINHGKISIYKSSSFKSENLIQTDNTGYFDFYLNNTLVENSFYIIYEPFDVENSAICIDYLTKRGKEITTYTKTTKEQKTINLFKEKTLEFYIDTTGKNEVVEALLPEIEVVSESMTVDVSIEIRDSDDSKIEQFSFDNMPLKNRINFHSEKNKNYIYIKISLNFNINNSIDNVYKLIRPEVKKIEDKQDFKIDVNEESASEISEVPLVYYYPLYTLKDKQMIYYTNMENVQELSTYLWYNNLTSELIMGLNFIVIDEDMINTNNKAKGKEDTMLTIFLYGNIPKTNTTSYFVDAELIKYTDLEFNGEVSKMNYITSNQIFTRSKDIIYELQVSGVFKLTNIVGNSALYYNKGSFEGKPTFSDEFINLGTNYEIFEHDLNDYRLYKPKKEENSNVTYFTSLYSKVDDGFSFSEPSIVQYPNYENGNNQNIYKSKGTLNMHFKPSSNFNYFVIKLANDLPEGFSESFTFISQKTGNIEISKENSIHTFNLTGNEQFDFSITSENETLFEINTLSFNAFVQYVYEPSENFTDLVFDNEGTTVIVYNFQKSSGSKYINVEIENTDFKTSAYKFIGDCNVPPLSSDTINKNKKEENETVSFTFANDFAFTNNKLYQEDNECLVIVIEKKNITQDFESIPLKIYYSEKQPESIEPTPSPAPDSGSSGLEGWEIALIVIACVIVLAIIIFLLYKFVFSKQQKLEDVSPAELQNIKENEGLVE